MKILLSEVISPLTIVTTPNSPFGSSTDSPTPGEHTISHMNNGLSLSAG